MSTKYLLWTIGSIFFLGGLVSCKNGQFVQDPSSQRHTIEWDRKSKKDKRKSSEEVFEHSSKKASAPAKTVIRSAKSYIGTPYKYGGTSRNGMDCSALTMLSFRNAGMSLPRTSSAQSQVGKSIRITSLQPGDLVFFSYQRNRKVSHVGIVTEVANPKSDITFIHASTSLGVVESNLYSAHYQKVYVGARRVLD